MGTKTSKTIVTILFIFSASVALARRNAGSSQMEACVDGSCLLGGRSALRFPSEQDFKLVLQKVNLIDKTGQKRDLRRKPQQVGFDPKMFTPVGTVSPNQRIIDTDVQNWKKDGTKTWIEKGEYAATSFMVSPCHVLTNYHAVFGGSTNPNKTDYSATVTIRHPISGEPIPLMARPVVYGYLDVEHPKQREDWVLLETERCFSLSSGVGWMELDHISETSAKIPANVAGYYGEKLDFLVQKDCELRYFTSDNDWVHDCAAKPGSSGPPIFRVVDGVPRVMAMIWGGISNPRMEY
jgi:V8-like Glu-specific endopeptidase